MLREPVLVPGGHGFENIAAITEYTAEGMIFDAARCSRPRYIGTHTVVPDVFYYFSQVIRGRRKSLDGFYNY